jgi:hypothetical protein
MTIKNKKGRLLEVNHDEWDLIVRNNDDYKYELVNDNVPIEIKSLKPRPIEMKPKKKNND